MTKYELTYLTVGEESANAESVRDTLTQNEAVIESVNNWTGRRKLVYPIKKQDQAFYTTVVFAGEPSTVKPISDALLSNEEILRSLIVHYVPQPERGGTGEPEKTEPKVAKIEPVETEKAEVVTESAHEEEKSETKPKRTRVKKEKTEEEAKALDDKLEELLHEDITK